MFVVLSLVSNSKQLSSLVAFRDRSLFKETLVPRRNLLGERNFLIHDGFAPYIVIEPQGWIR